MKFRTVLTASALAVAVAGCGGGGGGGNGMPGPSATPTPPPALRNSQVFYIITLSSQRQTEVVPAGSAPVPPAGGSVGGPVPGAVITYPDGTTQTADQNGIFNPAVSPYVQSNLALIATSPVTQPHIKASTPSGDALGSSAYVAGYGSVTAPTGEPIAGAFLLPTATELFAGGQAVLHAEGTDIEDLVASLAQDTITWTSADGATVTPIPGTADAVYNAPSVSGASVLSDVVTATVRVPNSPVPFTATAQVTVLGPGAGYTVSGTLATASGSAIPGGTALFVQDDRPRIFPSFNWFALAGANGAYQGLIPANTDFGTAIGAPAASAPGGAANFLPALVNLTGEPDFTSLAAGQAGTVNLTISGSTGLDDKHDDASAAYPPPIAQTRDAWYATIALAQPYPYDADSGLQPLLTVPSTFPSPAAPALVGSGLFARWCYQWTDANGTPELVVVDNASASSCSQPGDTAFAITPQTQPGSYAFVQYVLPKGAYALAAPLDPAPSGAMLLAGGTWNGPASATNVQLAFYDPLDQVPAAPLYTQAFQYAYASSGGLATVTITNSKLIDPLTGHLLQSIPSATVSQIAPLGGPGGCVQGSTQPALCYHGTATLTHYEYTPAGTLAQNFTVDAQYYGDGSATRSFGSASATDRSEVLMPFASDAARTAGSCFVCNAGGSFIDTDGRTQIGAFSIATGGVVTFDLLNTGEGGAPGSPVDALSFVF